MSQAIVFVGGIHGAGKTTVSRLLGLALSASHVTAGTLIRESAGRETITSAGIGNKAVPDMHANQELLLRGLALYRARTPGPIVLDGHFCLMKPDGTVVAVPRAVFEAIAPVAVVLIESEPAVVHTRLLGRDGAAPQLIAIGSLSERERFEARTVSMALKIPMLAVRGDVPADKASEVAASQLLPLLRGVA